MPKFKDYQASETIVQECGNFAVVRFAEYQWEHYFMGEHTYHYKITFAICKVKDGKVLTYGRLEGTKKRLLAELPEIAKKAERKPMWGKLNPSQLARMY